MMNKGLFVFLGLIALLIGVGAAWYLADSTPTAEVNAPRATQPATTKSTPSGTLPTGDSTPLLAFTAADYAAALATNKLIVLYFYANWCPICAEEFPHMQAAFNELTTDQVIGFQVNFNDSETDADEENLAREHGIAYQHTKVFVRGGQQILKSPETWPQDRYLNEINTALAE